MKNSKQSQIILPVILIIVSILALTLNIWVLSYNTHRQKKLATDILTNQKYRGIKGPKGYGGIPGRLSSLERTFESWPITLMYDKDKTGHNSMFGDWENWFSLKEPPTFGIDQNGITTLKLNFFNQNDQTKRIFYKTDRIFFDFDIALDTVNLFNLGIVFNIKNFEFQNHLATEYTKILHRRLNDKAYQLKYQKLNSKIQKKRAQFVVFKTQSINRIKIQGRISFTYHGIYIDIFSTLIDEQNTINQFTSTSKIRLDNPNDNNERYEFESIQIGEVDSNGVLFKNSIIPKPIWKDGTKIQFRQDPSNYELIRIHKSFRQTL